MASTTVLTLVTPSWSCGSDSRCGQKAEKEGVDLEQHVDYRFGVYELVERVDIQVPEMGGSNASLYAGDPLPSIIRDSTGLIP